MLLIIKIVDDLMGKGKSSWAIQKIKEDDEGKYIYITPFLSEIQRVKESCSNRKFVEPLNKGYGKLDNLHNLLYKESHIASTHALFKMATKETRELIRLGNYTLILDEVMDVVEEVKLKKNDLKSLFDLELIKVENHKVIWNESKLDYESRYDDIKYMALNNSLFVVNNKLLMWTFPVDIFNNFKEIYILTYLFKGQLQCYYYDLYNVKYEFYNVVKDNDKYNIIKSNSNQHENEYKKLFKNNIKIIDDRINDIGDYEYALSVSWYRNSENKMLINKLKNNLYNYFNNKIKAPSKEIMWTTYKDYTNKLSGKGYKNRFLVLNARATNEYIDRKYLAYCCNIFLNPYIEQFFDQNNVKVNQDIYALSELLQWTWRSCIRKNEKIYIYIPSKRMRELLIKWLDNKI